MKKQIQISVQNATFGRKENMMDEIKCSYCNNSFKQTMGITVSLSTCPCIIEDIMRGAT